MNTDWTRAAWVIYDAVYRDARRGDYRAEGAARDLHDAGLLAGQAPRNATMAADPHAAVVETLRCRMDESDARRVADLLAAGGMLADRGA